ncbi:MAG: restriction endonuclease subunit S [Cyclobacteriaceae bacterium]
MKWEFERMGEVFKVTSGGTPNRKKEYYFNNGTIPWVKTGDLKGKFAKSPPEFITQEALKNSSAKIFPKETVLLAMYGATIGACSILPFEAATNQACAALLPSAKCDSEYLYYYLLSIKNDLIKKGVGGAQPNISGGIIKDTKIPLPPLATQKKIAAILDAADAHRQKTRQLLAKYDELAQSIFLEMFGDPVTNPKGWEVKKMKEITSKIMSGNTPKGGKEVYVENGILFIRSQNVWRNKLDLGDVAFIDEETHNKMCRSSLRKGDILMTKTGRFNTENSSLGRAAMFKGKDNSANVNGHVYFMRPKPGVNGDFVLYILTTIQYREYIRRICVGGIDKRQLNKDHLEDFPIIYPKKVFQDSFTEKLKLINQQKELLEKENLHSNDLFNGLLQKAFKGELVS